MTIYKSGTSVYEYSAAQQKYDIAYAKAKKRTWPSVMQELVRVIRAEDPSEDDWRHALVAADKIIKEWGGCEVAGCCGLRSSQKLK